MTFIVILYHNLKDEVDNKTNFCYNNSYQNSQLKEWVGRPLAFVEAGGKSEQDRARWWLTATRGNPRESATENTQPMISACRNTGNGEMVR